MTCTAVTRLSTQIRCCIVDGLRYQMGYIKLTCPLTHVWYLKRLPSYIASHLDKPL